MVPHPFLNLTLPDPAYLNPPLYPPVQGAPLISNGNEPISPHSGLIRPGKSNFPFLGPYLFKAGTNMAEIISLIQL
jgi:hypothetical protein